MIKLSTVNFIKVILWTCRHTWKTIKRVKSLKGCSSFIYLFIHLLPFKAFRLNIIITHYPNMPMQYTAIFKDCKMILFRWKCAIYFLIFAQNIDCGYLGPKITYTITNWILGPSGYTLEPSHWGGSNEYPQSMFWAKLRKMCIPAKRKVVCSS